MEFIGEHLFPGQLGHFCAVLSFAASLVAAIAYFMAAHRTADSDSWRRLARAAFLTEIVSVLLVIGSIFFILTQHYYEYFYAWNHTSNETQLRYVVAGFWESSEGSFLLWTFWNCVLGLVLMNTAGKWESAVLTVISFAQLCLASMILGIYFFHIDIHMGTNPFILMRQYETGAPIFSRPDYMSFPVMQDGRGLNPLLQNYWMVIHPPVLFLGFASTIVPFAYAISGLWLRDFSGWVKPVLPWALFSAAILGTGVIMGAAWAYESLTFGGFWAWDPVENASLVPWLVLICGIHTLLAYKHTGHSLRITFAFLILTFLLILYSTFLTRSGILGDTSVHAFTDSGLNGQLLMFLFAFVVPSITLFVARYRRIPSVRTEEAIASREFWMFVGSLLLFLSALYIIGFTSIPVYDKIFGRRTAPPEDVMYAYNKVMILVIIVVALLMAMTQYLKYKATTSRYFWSKIGIPSLVSLVLAALLLIFGHFDYLHYGEGFLIAICVALVASVYAIVANMAYIWAVLRGRLANAGASVAHVGFGMMLLGILISTSEKKVISENTSGIFVPGLKDARGKAENPFENLTLLKGVDFKMKDYRVTYVGDSLGGPKDARDYFRLQFVRPSESFTLYPDAFINAKKGEEEGIIANPDAKHYLDRDIFVYLTSLPSRSRVEDTSTYRDHSLKPGDTLFYSSGLMIFNGVLHGAAARHDLAGSPSDSVFTADITVHAKDSSLYKARPTLVVSHDRLLYYPDTVMAAGLMLRFSGAGPSGIKLGVRESNAIQDFVTVKAYVFPYINLLKLGTVVMVVGLGMSVVRRARLS